ncbi:hypothetical protein DPMN_157248 [Dreissena polymorpha]|uniref:Uncharacterized protein n=1 Tax=Dreissena polymorpha TaxID=45954 RepID=A0A9D4EGY8_DREPO|nr:hypothetical protein DPMN_157228 [Dreissena polymorpha]KAH3779445.1 hypothetical protein DPMN_157248 [Dreissena polymorpha]
MLILNICHIYFFFIFPRQYWVSDLAWTSDNLFLAGILKNGSVCLIPRLGDPVAIATDGCSVTMGPSLFLPLHPAIFVRYGKLLYW